MQGTFGVAQQLFALAAADFAASDPADGFSQTVGGLDALLVFEPEYLLMGLTDTVLGSI